MVGLLTRHIEQTAYIAEWSIPWWHVISNSIPAAESTSSTIYNTEHLGASAVQRCFQAKQPRTMAERHLKHVHLKRRELMSTYEK